MKNFRFADMLLQYNICNCKEITKQEYENMSPIEKETVEHNQKYINVLFYYRYHSNMSRYIFIFYVTLIRRKIMKSFKPLSIILSCLCLVGCNNAKPESENTSQKDNQVTTTTTITTTNIEATTEVTTAETIPTEPIEDIEEADLKTFIATTFAMNIPTSWNFNQPINLNYEYPTTIYSYDNGDLSFMIEEQEIGSILNMSDDEIFDERINQFWDEEDCVNVEIYALGDIKYALSSYSNDNNFHIYAFVHNGYLYQFDAYNLNLLPNEETIIEDMFNSIVFNIEDIQLTNVHSFDGLSSDEKQYLIKSIMFYNEKFTNPKSIIINQCCIYLQNGEEMMLQDLTYTSSSNETTTNTFLYNRTTNSAIILDQTYAETLSVVGDTVITYNAELLNQTLTEYFES